MKAGGDGAQGKPGQQERAALSQANLTKFANQPAASTRLDTATVIFPMDRAEGTGDSTSKENAPVLQLRAQVLGEDEPDMPSARLLGSSGLPLRRLLWTASVHPSAPRRGGPNGGHENAVEALPDARQEAHGEEPRQHRVGDLGRAFQSPCGSR